jgi:hypothetical protein
MQSAQIKISSDAKWTVSRLGRLMLFIVSFGFVYPNVWIEGMDLTAYDDKNDAGVKR